MKKIILIASLLAYSVTTFGQELRNQYGDIYYEPDLYKTKYNSSKGSPYLNEEFTPAKINDIEETKLVRFDAVEQNVEVMISGNKVVALDNSKSYIISLLDDSKKVYETLKYIDAKGNVNTSFFELLDSTINYKIYLKEKKKFFKKVKTKGYGDAEPAQFKKIKSEFYVTDFKNQSDQLLTIPQKFKSFTEFFQDDSNSIKKFVKENKLKIGNPNDLVKIFKYYFKHLN